MINYHCILSLLSFRFAFCILYSEGVREVVSELIMVKLGVFHAKQIFLYLDPHLN